MAVSLPGRHTPCASFAALGALFLLLRNNSAASRHFPGGYAAFLLPAATGRRFAACKNTPDGHIFPSGVKPHSLFLLLGCVNDDTEIGRF